jgi:hypothetical protein
MSSKKSRQRQAAANRRNARGSTGPQSEIGKSVARWNALSHGLSSISPVIRGEKKEDWEVHRADIIATSAPTGTMEMEMAERVALLTWRLRRIVRYETAVMNGLVRTEDDKTVRAREVIHEEHALALEKYREAARLNEGYHQLKNSRDGNTFEGPMAVNLLFQTREHALLGKDLEFNENDGDFLCEIGVPEEWHDKLKSWDGWTTSILMKGISAIAASGLMCAEELLKRVCHNTKKAVDGYTAQMKSLEMELAGLTRKEVMRSLMEEELLRESTPVMDQTALDKVIRYETHLSKQLLLALELLHRLQVHRLRCSSIEREKSDSDGVEDGEGPTTPNALLVETPGGDNAKYVSPEVGEQVMDPKERGKSFASGSIAKGSKTPSLNGVKEFTSGFKDQ